MPVYSNSQLAAFEQCPLKYKFRYIDKIAKPAKSVEAFTGSLVHLALQKLHRDLIYRKLNPLDHLLAWYFKEWGGRWNSEVRLVREGIGEDQYRQYGADCITNYYRRHHPFKGSVTLGTEVHLVFNLDEARRSRYQGYVDRLARRPDGTFEIHDYKTAISLRSQASADQDRQLALYQYGVQLRWPGAESIELIWHYVGLDCSLVSRRTPEQITVLRKETADLIEKIESASEFPPVRSRLCDWCEFRQQCPLWMHVDAARAMPPEELAQDSGFRLVNEFARAKAEAGALESKIAGLRDQILAFALHRGVRVIAGDGVEVSISDAEAFSLPARGEATWQEMESMARASGHWESLSELSARRVSDFLKSDQSPADIRASLARLVRPRKSTQLRLRHGNESIDE